jgi:predicted alpha/beta hydrolase family esterase
LVLHGTGNNSQGNWFPWLKRELEEKQWQVWVPDLPDSDYPNIKRYNRFLLNNKEWKFDKESVLIGHSAGAVAILGLLQVLPENVQVDTCYLIGAFKDDLGWDVLDGLFEESFDFEYIKARAKKFVFIHSDNDPYCPLEHARFLAQKLDGELIVKKGQKHFSFNTMGKKYKKFPFLLSFF